jgi:hypothetical protein
MATRHRSDPGSGSGAPRFPGTFLLAFREAVTGLGWQLRRWLGDAVECVDAEGREQVVGLENLYRRAKRAERADWPELISSFLQTSQMGPIDDPPKDLASVADQILVRLGPPLATQDGPEVWQKPIEGTGLCLSLVIDFPQSMFYVTAALVEESEKPGEDWLDLAVQNLLKKTPPESFQVVHEESGLKQSCVGDAYDSSRVLLVSALVPEGAQYGVMVAMPGRDELLVMPVNKMSLQFLPLLKMAAEKNFKNAPYPISDEVFWIREGKWHLFPIKLRNHEANVRPPDEFIPVIKELVPESADEEEVDETEDPDVPLDSDA